MGALSTILFIIVLIAIVVLFWPKINEIIQIAQSVISNNHGSNFNFSTNYSSSNQNVSSGPIINYTLSLINKDRAQNGLPSVSLSSESSGQQHADSMLQYNYFSHWDIYGMKPYMRYTLLGGKGSVQENVAYTKSGVKACIANLCTTYGNINVTNSIKQMEYNMIYNDSGCCNNGHRDNILNPYHNQISIGVAYNSTTVYLVEDFINNYITWLNNTPSYNNDEIYLKGVTTSNYQISNIEIGYESPVSNMTQQQLDRTSEYSYGTSIAGVTSSSLNYYPNLITIVADNYYANGNDFQVAFNLQNAIKQYGSGEYTVALWLNGSNSNGSFVGSTYTFFVNSNGNIYTPQSI